MKEDILSVADTIEKKTEQHPCFHCGAGKNARIHLPIAPKCNIQCNYCVRKFDCINESRPGVVSSVLSPAEAVERFIQVKKDLPNLTVVGIAGPGDPLANFEEVKETLKKIRQIDKNITFCLSTNGLMLPFYANHLISLGVTHVTVTVNTVEPSTGAKIYKYIRYLGKEHNGYEGASILLQNQLSGIRYLASMGIVVKVNIVLMKGINDNEINDIVYMVKDCGCKITNIMQLIPVKGSCFEDMKVVSMEELNKLRREAENMLPQMYHCKQCRADAIGTLTNDVSLNYACCSSSNDEKVQNSKNEPLNKKYRFAVCSKEGKLIDLHFGHTTEFLIYDYNFKDSPEFVEKRETDKYCNGVEDGESSEKISFVSNLLSDCDAVICMRIGDYPQKMLKEKNILVFTTYNRVIEGIKEAAGQLSLIKV